MQNALPISAAAIAILCRYPMLKIRSDMAFDEYIAYKNDWNTFNHAWAYNYTVRALGSGTYYQFSSYSEQLSYTRGQLSHFSIYPDAAAAGVFNNIP